MIKELVLEILREELKGSKKQPYQENADLVVDLIEKPVLVETATKYYSGVLSKIDCRFLRLTQAQWVASTGKFSDYMIDPEGDSNAEFEPCNDVTISLGAICTIIPLNKIIRKLK